MKKKKWDRTEEFFFTFLKVKRIIFNGGLNQWLSCSKRGNKRDCQLNLPSR